MGRVEVRDPLTFVFGVERVEEIGGEPYDYGGGHINVVSSHSDINAAFAYGLPLTITRYTLNGILDGIMKI